MAMIWPAGHVNAGECPAAQALEAKKTQATCRSAGRQC